MLRKGKTTRIKEAEGTIAAVMGETDWVENEEGSDE